MQQLRYAITSTLGDLHMPNMRWEDIVEILIIAVLVYNIMVWIRNTRAFSLLRGILMVIAFVVFAFLFNMTTILWIVQNVTGIALTAIIVILQPELRNAMEELGQKNIISALFRLDLTGPHDGLFSDRTLNEITKACVLMGDKKTGALIVVEQNTPLAEYVRTGIDIDAVVSSQLLINIFEKNTPLHDGAVIIRGDRVVSATCYLPMSDNKTLDKNLGTRHRAGVGMSERSDSLTIIVSEETGHISVAFKGELERMRSGEELKKRLVRFQNKTEAEDTKGIFMPWRGKD